MKEKKGVDLLGAFVAIGAGDRVLERWVELECDIRAEDCGERKKLVWSSQTD
jgi:hypothetical protein